MFGFEDELQEEICYLKNKYQLERRIAMLNERQVVILDTENTKLKEKVDVLEELLKIEKRRSEMYKSSLERLSERLDYLYETMMEIKKVQ